MKAGRSVGQRAWKININQEKIPICYFGLDIKSSGPWGHTYFALGSCFGGSRGTYRTSRGGSKSVFFFAVAPRDTYIHGRVSSFSFGRQAGTHVYIQGYQPPHFKTSHKYFHYNFQQCRNIKLLKKVKIISISLQTISKQFQKNSKPFEHLQKQFQNHFKNS